MADKFKRNPKTAQLGHEILPFEMGYLPEFYQRKAEVELKDTPENRVKGLKILKDMISEDKHFHDATFDDDFLLQYLRCRKFDATRALSALKAFVNLQNKNKNMFRNFKFENMSVATKKKIFTFLPYRCQDGCAILLIKLDNWDPEEFIVEEIRRTAVIYFLQSLRDIMTQVNGFKVIFDVKSTRLSHIRYITPTNIGLICKPQDCVAGRYKEIHIVNQSLVFTAAFIILKQVLNSKLKNRFFIHSSPQELLDYFPAACMPVEYGGELEDYDLTNWLRDVTKPEKLETLGGRKFPLK